MRVLGAVVGDELLDADQVGRIAPGEPELVAALSAPRVEIYADRLTAQIQFPQLAGNAEMAQTIDLQANPLSPYVRER